MLRVKKRKNNSESQTQLLENGGTPERLKLLESKMVLDCTTSGNLSNGKVKLNQRKKVISIAESQVLNKKKTSKDKSNISKKNIPCTKSSKKSQAELISNEKDLTKYWLSQCQALSKRLWLPTGTGSVGSHGNISNGCLNFTECMSSLKINRIIAQNPSSAMTSCLSSTFFPRDTMVCAGNIRQEELKQKRINTLQKQENKTHARLVKTNPTRIKKKITNVEKFIVKAKCIKALPIKASDRRTINDAIAVTRKLWNCCVNEVHKRKNPELTLNYLRDKFVTESNMSESMKKQLSWTFRISQKVREQVIQTFLANYKTAIKNFKKSQYKFIYKTDKKTKKVKKIKKKIVMRFKNINDNKQTFQISKDRCEIENIDGKSILHTFNGVNLKLSEELPEGVPEAAIILSRVGFEYYIYVPTYNKPLSEKIEAPNRIVGIDPGNNIFATTYSPDGEWSEIGMGIVDKIDKEVSKIKKLGLKLRGKSKFKAIRKIECYIHNMIDDFQWKLCHWLLSHYRKIIIPRLYVARANKTVKRQQRYLRHCDFINRLMYKTIEYNNSEVHICKEHNTSKACTKCLSLNTIKNKIVKCEDCGHEIHRDLNGSRNMLLKHCF
jgi:transposase